MVKQPRPGRVKTRLGSRMGMVPAVWWSRHTTAALLRAVRDRRWEVVLAVAPDRAGLMARDWPGDLMRLPQGRGDLGRRMARALAGFSDVPVVLVGADIPDLRRHHIAQAFQALGSAEVVFGPATDGGYWLVGLRRGLAPPKGMFEGVRWSGPHALADSVASLPGRRIAYAATLRDVDEVEDLAFSG